MSKEVESLKEVPNYKELKKAKWKFVCYEKGDKVATYKAKIGKDIIYVSIQLKQHDYLFGEPKELLSKEELKRYHYLSFTNEDEKEFNYQVNLSKPNQYLKYDYDSFIEELHNFTASLKCYIKEKEGIKE